MQKTAEKAQMRLKKEAAKMKAHIIFIQNQETKTADVWSGASSIQNGVAYGY